MATLSSYSVARRVFSYLCIPGFYWSRFRLKASV